MAVLKQTFTLILDDGQEHHIGDFTDSIPQPDTTIGAFLDRLRQDFRAALSFKASPDLDALVAREVHKKHCSPELAPACGRCKGGCRWLR